MQSNRITRRGVLTSVRCYVERNRKIVVIANISWDHYPKPDDWCSDDDHVILPAAEVAALLGKWVEATIEFEPASDGEEWDIVELKEIEV